MATQISVYLDDGRVFEYEVDSSSKGREHASKIISTGYRSTNENNDHLEWYPPHRIDKVRVCGAGESTRYKDKVRST